MKVAVSIPDDVFAAADRYALEARKSRSAVYALALADFLNRRRRDRITEEINAALDGVDEDDSAFAVEAGRRTVARNEW